MAASAAIAVDNLPSHFPAGRVTQRFQTLTHLLQMVIGVLVNGCAANHASKS